MTQCQAGELDRPPVPVPGCETCAGLAARRERARALYDRSAETDANVLLRHHQRREHGGVRVTTRRVFRYVPYTIVQDALGATEYEARCVSGDEAECGAESGVLHDPADVEEWQRRRVRPHGVRLRRRAGT